MSRRIFIAGPYGDGGPACEENVAAALRAANAVRDLGALVFVPHLFHFWHAQHPRPRQDWLDMDFEWLRICDAVLRIPGRSAGADDEAAKAIAWGMPVFHDLPTLGLWLRGAQPTIQPVNEEQ